jgi:uncharacterized BrkB/YihY/UPF0761 family membrane protein
LLCIAGAWWAIRLTAASIASAPASWHERFASEYEEALAFGVRDALPVGLFLRGLAFWLPIFVLLDRVDVIPRVQLGAVAVYAAWETAGEQRRRREERPEWRAAIRRDPRYRRSVKSR